MLQKYLKKLGLTSFSDLNEEEKKTFREGEEALSGRKLTDKEVEEWLNAEYDIATSRICEEGLDSNVITFRQVEIKFIKKILNFINSPKVAQQVAVKSIQQLMD